MGFKTTSEHSVTNCPSCNRKLNMQAASKSAPWQSLTVCVYCGDLLDFRSGLPIVLTKDKFLMLPKQIQQNLERGQYEASKVRPAMLIAYEGNTFVTPEELE